MFIPRFSPEEVEAACEDRQRDRLNSRGLISTQTMGKILVKRRDASDGGVW